MKQFLMLFSLLLVLTLCNLTKPEISHGVSPDTIPGLRITEVMPDPAGKDEDLEWLELSNTGTAAISLSGWSINGKNLPQSQLTAGSFLILAANPELVRAHYHVTATASAFTVGLTNSGGILTLKDPTNAVVQVFTYGQAREDVSFELLQGGCGSVQWNPEGNSISRTNHDCQLKITATPSPTPKFTPVKVEISQICPDPADKSEYLTLKNSGSEAVSINNWQLLDLSGHIQKLTGQTIAPGGQIRVMTREVSLNNDGDSIFLVTDSGRQTDVLTYPKGLGQQCYPLPAAAAPAATAAVKCPAITAAVAPQAATGKTVTYSLAIHFAMPLLYLNPDVQDLSTDPNSL